MVQVLQKQVLQQEEWFCGVCRENADRLFMVDGLKVCKSCSEIGRLNTKKERVNNDIRLHEEKAQDWDLQSLAAECYLWADIFNKHFFEKKLPLPVISFDSGRANVLGHYVTERNGIGVKDNINLTKDFVLNSKKWERLEVLIHELVHLYQRRLGRFSKIKKERSRRNYHQKDFIEKMASTLIF